MTRIWTKYNDFNRFDEVTNFRLINSVLVTFGMNIMIPLLTVMKGQYLAPFVISLFMIAGTVAVKTNDWFIKRFTLSEQYKIGVVVHLLMMLTFATYFYSPTFFIVADSFLLIIEIAVFSGYSISLDVYQMKYYSHQVSDFKVFRNSVMADSTLIGLALASILALLLSASMTIVAFMVFHVMFLSYLVMNWNLIHHIMLKTNRND